MRKAEIVINAIVAKKTNSADLSRITNIDAEQGTVELNGEKIASIVSHYNFVEMYVAQEEAQTNEEQVEEKENNEVLTSNNSQVSPPKNCRVRQTDSNNSQVEDSVCDPKNCRGTNNSNNSQVEATQENKQVMIQALEEVLRGAKKIDV